MPKRLTHRLLALVLLLSAYEYIIGFPRFYDGRWVHRSTQWYGLSEVCPIPYLRGEMHYVYIDTNGIKVKHGSYVTRHSFWVKETVGQYRDGKEVGTWIKNDGAKEFFKNGKIVGWTTKQIDGSFQTFGKPEEAN